MKNHYYMPDYQAMGDCRVCGHEQKKPWHIGETMPIEKITSALDGKVIYERKPPMSKSLTFDDLRFANVQRNKEWDPDNKIVGLFRSTEFAGEAGEVCNKIKKLERERLGLKGSRATIYELAMEIADAQITLDLIAMHYNIDIAEATRLAFNAKSDEYGFETRIE